MSDKVIVSAALTGAMTDKKLSPYIPLTPAEIAEDAYNCWKAGAAIVHLHMRDENGIGTMDRDKFEETIRLIRAHEDCDVVINCTSSGTAKAVPYEERMDHPVRHRCTSIRRWNRLSGNRDRAGIPPYADRRWRHRKAR